jgi:hypothetical protein
VPQRGRYESRFLRAVHPTRAGAVWIRQTTNQSPGEAPTVAAWCILWEDGAPRAVKQSGHEATGWLDRAGARGSATAKPAGVSRHAAWELEFAGGDPPLRHLPRDWMYRAPLPRTKLESPRPAVRVTGWVECDGHRVELDGWPGTTGHNWGSEHAARWVWLHGIGFAERPGMWLDVALGRVRLGRVLTPWVANGAIRLEDGERVAVGGIARRAIVQAQPGRLSATLPGADGLCLTVRATAPRQRTIAFTYTDPAGGGHEVLNCSVAGLDVRVERPGRAPLSVTTAHGGAYELGLPAPGTHGVPLEPYPDP